MPILCLEGASAVGKSTTCKELSKRYGAYIVEEVAVLFPKPNLFGNELMHWILERQIERWNIAISKLDNHNLVVLDGDHIKIWYSWVYGLETESLDYYSNYYRKLILDTVIGFPDLYVVLTIDEEELRKRKINDLTRNRGNFEKHINLIEPQKQFFRAIDQLKPNYVQFIEATTIEQNVQSININSHNEDKYSIELFDYMINWLRNNKPE
jgi:deoxyadenosine/deoxycytidine kinase